MLMAQLISMEFILGRNNLIRLGRFNYAIWDNEEMYRLPLESGMPWYAMQLVRENGVSDATFIQRQMQVKTRTNHAQTSMKSATKFCPPFMFFLVVGVNMER